MGKIINAATASKTVPAKPATIAEQIKEQLSPEEQKAILLAQLAELGVNASDIVSLGIKSDDLIQKENEEKEKEINKLKDSYEKSIRKHLDTLSQLAGYKGFSITWQDAIERVIKDENGVDVTEKHPEGWVFAYSGDTIKVSDNKDIKPKGSVPDKVFNTVLGKGWTGRGMAPDWVISALTKGFPSKTETYLRDIIKVSNETTAGYKEVWDYLTTTYPPAQ